MYQCYYAILKRMDAAAMFRRRNSGRKSKERDSLPQSLRAEFVCRSESVRNSVPNRVDAEAEIVPAGQTPVTSGVTSLSE